MQHFGTSQYFCQMFLNHFAALHIAQAHAFNMLDRLLSVTFQLVLFANFGRGTPSPSYSSSVQWSLVLCTDATIISSDLPIDTWIYHCVTQLPMVSRFSVIELMLWWLHDRHRVNFLSSVSSSQFGDIIEGKWWSISVGQFPHNNKSIT